MAVSKMTPNRLLGFLSRLFRPYALGDVARVKVHVALFRKRHDDDRIDVILAGHVDALLGALF